MTSVMDALQPFLIAFACFGPGLVVIGVIYQNVRLQVPGRKLGIALSFAGAFMIALCLFFAISRLNEPRPERTTAGNSEPVCGSFVQDKRYLGRAILDAECIFLCKHTIENGRYRCRISEVLRASPDKSQYQTNMAVDAHERLIGAHETHQDGCLSFVFSNPECVLSFGIINGDCKFDESALQYYYEHRGVKSASEH